MPRSGRCLVLALDSYGDLVLRQPLLTGLADAGYDVHVAVRRGYERVLPLLDGRLTAVPLPFEYGRAPDVTEAREALDAVARLAPALVVSAQFDPVRYVHWCLGAARDAFTAGLTGGRVQDVPGASVMESQLGVAPAPPFDLPVACDEALPEPEKYALLLRAIAAREPASRPRIQLPAPSLAAARAAIQDRGLAEGAFVACWPAGTANVALKAWPAEKFAACLSWAVEERGAQPLVLGHRSEEATVAAVVAAARARGHELPVWLGADEDFVTMAAILSLAATYLGNDTGPMHLAAAAGVPVVALFGGGHWPRFLPVAERGAAHTRRLPCFGCGWRECVFVDAPCVGAVDEADVCASLDRVLAGRPGFEVHAPAALVSEEALAKTVRAFRALSADAAARLDAIHLRDAEIQKRDAALDLRDAEIQKRDAALAGLRRANEAMGRFAPLVSIVTPTFNAERWIERCIESVRDQDYPRVEHIVVDGGSRDRTLEICSRYPQLIVYSAPDRGQSDALNRGFAMARGDVLAWLCADDEYRPGAISQAVAALGQGAQVVIGGCDFIDAEGRTISAHPANGMPAYTFPMLLRFWRYPTLPQPAVFWRRRLFERTAPLREDLYFAMDYQLWLQMARIATFERMPGTVAAYRIHPDAKCFADNYGSRIELIRVSRDHSPPRWHPRRWGLALSYRFSSGAITQHYSDAERLRDRAHQHLSSRRRLRAVAAFAAMHWRHPASRSVPGYVSLVRRLIAEVPPLSWARRSPAAPPGSQPTTRGAF